MIRVYKHTIRAVQVPELQPIEWDSYESNCKGESYHPGLKIIFDDLVQLLGSSNDTPRCWYPKGKNIIVFMGDSGVKVEPGDFIACNDEGDLTIMEADKFFKTYTPELGNDVEENNQ